MSLLAFGYFPCCVTFCFVLVSFGGVYYVFYFCFCFFVFLLWRWSLWASPQYHLLFLLFVLVFCLFVCWCCCCFVFFVMFLFLFCFLLFLFVCLFLSEARCGVIGTYKSTLWGFFTLSGEPHNVNGFSCSLGEVSTSKSMELASTPQCIYTCIPYGVFVCMYIRRKRRCGVYGTYERYIVGFFLSPHNVWHTQTPQRSFGEWGCLFVCFLCFCVSFVNWYWNKIWVN